LDECRLLLLCICMFGVVIWAAIIESQAPVRLGLLNTYKILFSLDDSLAQIKTLGDLSDYLKTVSKQARLIQPLENARAGPYHLQRGKLVTKML
jgi:hypothetical protein